MSIDSPRRIRGDLRFLRVYVYTVPTVSRYTPDPACEAESAQPSDVLGRVEEELAGEASRYRAAFAAIMAVALMPGLLAGFLWSGLYWLPVRIMWFPFDRGMYGLPYLSLYEWLAFLLLGAFFAYALSLTYTSRRRTRRLTVDYRRLVEADETRRAILAAEASDGRHPRAEFVLRTSPFFALYRPLLAGPADSAV